MDDQLLQTLTQFLDEASSRRIDAPAEFDLPDSSSKTLDIFIGNAEFPEETYWIICRRGSGRLAFLGRGNGSNYVECCYFGCSENVRQDCILDRDAVLAFAAMLPSVDTLSDPWHWVAFDEMFA